MPRGSRAVVFETDSKRFSLTELEPYAVQPGEVLVNVTCCTICGSDMHTYSGRRAGHASAVLGHEIIGTVESWAGPAPLDYCGEPIYAGQRITWGLSASCDDCRFCRSGMPQKCETLFKYGHAGFDNIRSTGGLADQCVLMPGTKIFPVPDELADEVACPANCATATVMAAIRLAEDICCLAGKRVLVVGLGMLGLTACAVCSAKGCETVVGIDPNSARRAMGREFGATDLWDSSELNHGKIKDEFDITLEFSGVSQAVDLAVRYLAIGGVAVLAGSVFPGSALNLDPENVVRRLLTVRGIHNYRAADLETALKFLVEHHRHFPFQKLVSTPFGLTDVQLAFDTATRGEFVRVAVSPEKR